MQFGIFPQTRFLFEFEPPGVQRCLSLDLQGRSAKTRRPFYLSQVHRDFGVRWCPAYFSVLFVCDWGSFIWWQFCTTPPGGILVGLSLKSVGSIPTVTIPNPDQPPLVISLTSFIFSTKRKILGATTSKLILTLSHKCFECFFHLVFNFICDMWNVWKSESWPLKLMIVYMIGTIQNDGGTGNNRTVQT